MKLHRMILAAALAIASFPAGAQAYPNKPIKALQAADVREKLSGLGFEIQSSTSQELSALLRKESEKWAGIVKASGARAE